MIGSLSYVVKRIVIMCITIVSMAKVDTTACLFRVDAGLKTVAGAKKFVPGSKLNLQPNIKPSVHPTRQKPGRGDRSRNTSLRCPVFLMILLLLAYPCPKD